MNRELMKQCLDALDALTDKVDGTGFSDSAEFSNALDVISFIKQELEKPEPEPVAWRLAHRFYSSQRDAEYAWKNECVFLGTSYVPEPLYAAPTEPNCKFPTCHSQEYQDKLVQEILGQEPVAYMLTTRNLGLGGETWDTTEYRDYQWDCDCIPLYTKGAPNV